MGVLNGKKITIALIVMLSAMVFSLSIPSPALAQSTTAPSNVTAQPTPATKSVDSGKNGAADVATRLGITGYRAWVFSAITSVGTAIAWLGGSLFDMSISHFAANMVDTMDSLGLRVAINNMWVIIRDLFNLLFIFGLIYSGFKIILDANDSASKKNIVTIVMAALLINFSLYAAQVIVDFSNVATYQIFQLMAAPEGDTYLGIVTKNVSDSFIYLSGVDTLGSTDQKAVLLSEVGAQTGEAEVNNIGSAILLGLLFCLFYIVLGFVFAAGAATLFVRFFTLTILMIFSPMMFLGWVLPGLKSHTNKWWDKFTKQALIGPAFLFMIYLSLRALQGIGNTGQDGGLIAVSLYLIIVTAFLWASLKVANSLGAYGSEHVIKFAGATTFGLAGRLGRSTIGRAAQNISQREGLRDAAARRGALGWMARRTFDASSAVGDASFDARNIRGAGKLGFGEGKKGGFATRTKEIAEKEKKYAEKLGSVGDDDEFVKKAQLEVDATERAIDVGKEKINEAQKKITELQNKKASQSEDEQKKTQQEIDVKRAEIAEERGKIDSFKEDLEKKKETVQKEKSRRQLGTDRNTPLHANRIKAHKDRLKKELAKYAEEKDDTKKDSIREEIANIKREIANEEKDAKKYDGGYASTVELDSLISRKFFFGRTRAQNENAADDIRKEYKKKSKAKE